MSEEATLEEQGVDEVETEELEETEEVEIEEESVPLSAREEMVRRMSERQKEERQKVEEEPEEEAIQEDVSEPEEPEIEYVTIKVDGKEQKVPKDRILEQGIRTMQKESAADHRMESANRRMKELQRYEAHLREQLEKADVPQKVSDDEKERFAKALVEDEDVAAEMFSTSQERVKELEAQFRTIAEKVSRSERFMQDQRVSETQRLNNLFKKEFPRLAKSARLRDMVNEETSRIMEEYPNMPKEDIVLQAGNTIMEEVTQSFGYDEPETPSAPRQVKEQMPKPVRKASGRRPSKPEPKPKTASDVIAEMAIKRRGY